METLQPKLRFPEFNGDWKLDIFKDLVKINQGLQIQITERYLSQVEDSHFYITNEFLKESSEKKYFIKNPPQSVLCDYDDILMTRTGNTGMVVTNVKGAFHNNFFKINYPKTIEKGFLYYFLTTIKTQNIIKSLAGTSTIPDLNHTDFYKINFIYSSKEEQTKIANFLTSVDKKLNLLKEKKSLLEDYKKGIMQKIFNQEIRFKDDNGNDFEEWENKTLGECLNFEQPTKYLVDSTDYNDDFETPVLTAGKTFILGYTNEVNGIFNKEELPVIIFDDFTTATQFVDFPFKAKSSAMKILKAKKNVNIKFVYEAMQNLKFEVGGHGRHWISIYSNIMLNIPTKLEQDKIGSFAFSINKKIELVSNQIKHTQEYKKGLLQQMFV
jgi:type I restriction enzyme S subunit